MILQRLIVRELIRPIDNLAVA